MSDDDMKDEYDFTNAERGKFYRPGMVIRLPVYLEKDIQDYLSETAERRGVTLSNLVNELLKNDIAIIQAVK